MTTIHTILTEFRDAANSNREMGDKFERLIANYLVTDPLQKERFSDVWLWCEWPGRGNQPDTGIDLVAKELYTGEYCAIQCKFYAKGHTVQKADIDSFFTASGKKPFTSRMIVATTEFGKHAEEAMVNQQPPVQRIRLEDLENSAIDWTQFSLNRPDKMKLRARKQLRPHQTKARVRLRGPMFDSQTDYATLRDAKLPNPGTEILSVPQYEQAKERLSELLSERASYLAGNRHASQKRTTTKERKNGANEKRFRPTNGRGSQPSGRNELPITANRLERNLFQTGGGQRGNANDRDTAKSACGPQEVADTSKHFGHSAGGPARGQRRQLGRFPAPTYGQTINAQIRELGIQLYDFEPWSHEAAAIIAQINALVGAREVLPKGPKLGR